MVLFFVCIKTYISEIAFICTFKIINCVNLADVIFFFILKSVP